MEKIKHGVTPTKLDKRDFSFHKTFAGVGVQLPPDFNMDAGFGMPNQNVPNEVFGFRAMPYGCTEYSASEICSDQDFRHYNPYFIETNVHANEKGGMDMRTPLNSICTNGVTTEKGEVFDFFDQMEAKKNRRDAYFRVGQNPDYFDGMRTAMFTNKRSITIGTPWFPEWNAAGWVMGSGIMPMPDLAQVKNLSWHCYKIAGWKTIDGEIYLQCKPWCGPNFGNNGWIYLSRNVFNTVMTVFGTAAFTVAKVNPTLIKTVGMSYVFKKNLVVEDNDPDVSKLQEALQSLGYMTKREPTTYFGLRTSEALAKFQKNYGIQDDGTHFGPRTRLAMNNVLNPSQTLFGSISLFFKTILGL